MTTEQDAHPAAEPGPWDGVIGQLRELRRLAGEPSYRLIALRVAEQRTQAGLPEHAARIAPSSVHDAFRLGRRRINLPLVRELARALGAGDEVVDGWLAAPPQTPASPGPPPAPHTPTPPSEPAVAPAPHGHVFRVLVACVVLNLMGRVLVDQLHLPIYLDMVGTAVAAVALGPWRGASVGAATNVLGILTSGLVSLPFAVVNIVGGLLWGYGVHSWRLGRTLPRYLLLNVLVATACTVLSVPLLMAVYGTDLRSGSDGLTQVLLPTLRSFPLAETAGNLLTSLEDKLISGFVALVVASALSARRPPPVDLPIVMS